MSKKTSIKLFQQKQVRSVWDEREEKWYFSVQDVVEVLTETVDAKDYIKKMKKRDPQLNSNWGTICPPVEMIAADGKRRKIQAADAKGLRRIVQSAPSPKEAKGLKNQDLRDHMTDLEFIFSMLGEASTTEIVKKKNPIGFTENQTAARQGGKIAGDARRALELETGENVVSATNYLPEKKQTKQINKQ